MEDLQLAISGGIIHWHPEIASTLSRADELIRQLQSPNGPTFSRLLIVGDRHAGKTALAAQVAINSQMPFVRMVTPRNVISGCEKTKCKAEALQAVIDDAYKSPAACVVLDDLESLIGESWL